MTGPLSARRHIVVDGRAEDRELRRSGRGGERIRDVERRAHGQRLLSQLLHALATADAESRALIESLDIEQLQSLGTIIVIEGAGSDFRLKLESLDRQTGRRGQQWLLLSVIPPTEERAESAVVWVSDEFRAKFIALFDDYLARDTRHGQPRNRALIANMASIRRAVLRDLWRSAEDPPPGPTWWEIWLRRQADGDSHLRAYAAALNLRIHERRLDLYDRAVYWVWAQWDDLQALPFTSVPITEIRRPEFIDTIEDLDRPDQDEYTYDLAERGKPAPLDAPAVCHLDTGVRQSHILLAGSLAPTDVLSVVNDNGVDRQGHGTRMAGLALYGPLDPLLTTNEPVALTHRLESVKLLPDPPGYNDPLAYGLVTAEAVAAAEMAAPDRSRVFCMPVTAEPEARPGEPSLWSAAVDALSVGTAISRSPGGIGLVGQPDESSARLFVISAGNVNGLERRADVPYLDLCETSGVQDPAQAWNALVVGAYTDLASMPTNPSFAGWTPLAVRGQLSPHSRTSVIFDERWPVKPDICMEGGNVLSNGVDFHDSHPLLSLRTTSHLDDVALGSANATSAATAQAARLAARAMAEYPSFWPETIRGLLVHAAEWTPAMKAEVDAAATKGARLRLLRRYGWGVPAEEAVLRSSRNAVTLVTQDQFVPFTGRNHEARTFRLHHLPWPVEVLRDLGEAEVQLRVTLSYFIEPNASRRGWRKRYAYASYGLRFELKGPQESLDDFVARINRSLRQEGPEEYRPSGRPDRWLLGSHRRHLGSLHQDIWSDGTAAELAECGLLAVFPVGGWWKYGQHADRVNLPVRYSLIVSLRTAVADVDLYTPIEVQLMVPIMTAVET
ncbi:MAG: S8 family peptidase [Micromonosporaceae bacterium]|nr:S8 family peptidase [Micromonosporaceae bacterium]